MAQQRVKTCQNNLNPEGLPCEKFISRFLSKEKPTTTTTVQRCRDKNVAKHSNQNQMSKMKPNVKQQNVPSPKNSQLPNNLFQYNDDSVLMEIPSKTTNLRHRSRSTTLEKGTWGQLLKQQKSGDKMSVFGNFDPLRTLHFLAKELQHQLQVLLPDETTVQQMITDIQYALKRVPPEVASTVHLQQALDLLPQSQKNSCSDFDKPIKPKSSGCERSTQTSSDNDVESHERLNRLMRESTLKFEESCKQMESVCTDLKKERDYLAQQLSIERENVSHLRNRIRDLELENTEILTPQIKALEEEKRKLEVHFAETAKNIESEALATTSDLKAQLAEAKNSKMLTEQECVKLRHQLKLTGLEKEKFVAILSVRDKQINEIRHEMTQLQEVVNEQLLELHNSAFKSRSGGEQANAPCKADEYDKENIGDATISTIYSKEENGLPHFRVPKSNHSFRDLPAGDLDYSSVLPEYQESDNVRNGGFSRKDHFPERTESQANIRNLFSEVKKTAYSVASTPRGRSQYNLHSNR